tara:strand:- start:70 stop:831 length:762 start_codon:yes stop_codon:yes gene_type:complete
MNITSIPCLSDNYAYILENTDEKLIGVVDPSEAQPIINFLRKKKLKLNYILNTHHHFDHVGGNSELKKLYNAKVVGFAGDKHRIPNIDITLKDNEEWYFGKLKVKILHIPGHTSGHICFFFEKDKIAFTGDTLFSLGCGKIFEGTHNQMYTSLKKIKNLPKETKIYCGHEYTYKNAKFCIEYDSNNIHLKKYFEKIKELRSKNLPTIPTNLGDELKLNIFLRCDQIELQTNLNMENQEDFKVFRKVRDLKDQF